MEEVRIGIELSKLKEIIRLLNLCLEPLVPYRKDPLEFAEKAHEVKDELVKNILSLLPDEVNNA